MSVAVSFLTIAAWLVQPAAVAGASQPSTIVGPPAPAEPRCSTNAAQDEIVVCGERYDEDSPYRIPRQFRGQGLIEDRHVSWDTRFRDQEALERFSNQNIGASGITQRSRQVDCEWRVARQQLRGERPDCGKGINF